MKITLTAAQAATLSKAIKPAISTEPMKLLLQHVKVSSVSNGATFTATDGYRMHELSIVGAADHHQIEILLNGKELVTALKAAATAVGRNNHPITIEYDYNNYAAITVNGGVIGSAEVSLLDFPSCAGFYNDTPDSENGAKFNAGFFADLMTAAETVSATGKGKDKAGIVTIDTMTTRKPCRVTATSDDGSMTFRGLLMPCRP